MSRFFLGIEGSYQTFEISLFCQKTLLQTVSANKQRASSQFLLLLQKLLENNKISLTEIAGVAVDTGPGAFTSLRVIIATINALAFEQRIPLVGIDGLDALAQETVPLLRPIAGATLLCLLNAYNNEAYYAVYSFQQDNQTLHLCMPKGYEKIEILLESLRATVSSNALFVTGNGAMLYEPLVKKVFSNQIQQPFAPLATCSSQQVAEMGIVCFEKNEGISYELLPQYLKTQTFAVRKR